MRTINAVIKSPLFRHFPPAEPTQKVGNRKQDTCYGWRCTNHCCCLGCGRGGEGGGAYSFVACLRHLTIDHASLPRRSTAPTPNKDTSNIWALITLLPYITYKLFAHPVAFLFRRLWPPSLSPRIAIVFLPLSCLPNKLFHVTYIYLLILSSPPLHTSRSSFVYFHIPLVPRVSPALYFIRDTRYTLLLCVFQPFHTSDIIRGALIGILCFSMG